MQMLRCNGPYCTNELLLGKDTPDYWYHLWDPEVGETYDFHLASCLRDWANGKIASSGTASGPTREGA